MYSEDSEPISRVVRGMAVVDCTGVEVGKVESVTMGDPEAADTQGLDTGTGAGGGAVISQSAIESLGVVGALADSVFGSEPDVPGPMAARLIRLGYVKVDARGLLEADRYVASDEVAEVVDDTVVLTVPKDRLTAETS